MANDQVKIVHRVTYQGISIETADQDFKIEIYKDPVSKDAFIRKDGASVWLRDLFGSAICKKMETGEEFVRVKRQEGTEVVFKYLDLSVLQNQHREMDLNIPVFDRHEKVRCCVFRMNTGHVDHGRSEERRDLRESIT